MARVKMGVAAKDYPEKGIAKGDTYYRWQLYRRPVQMSKTPPTRSQLTGSEFLQTVLDIEDLSIQGANTPEDLEAIADEVSNLHDETSGKLDNMPEGLRDGSIGELLQSRMGMLEDWETSIRQAGEDLQSRLESKTDEETVDDIVLEIKDELLSNTPSWE